MTKMPQRVNETVEGTGLLDDIRLEATLNIYFIQKHSHRET